MVPYLSISSGMKKPVICILLLLAASTTLAGARPPLRLTLISHNEEPSGPGQPDYLNNPSVYYLNREFLRRLATAVHDTKASWNFQSDWNFLKAVARYDTGAVLANTNGKIIVRWMKEDMGIECDPHAHETQYNYADVAYLFTQLGIEPSLNVGGFLYDPPDNSQGWEQHEGGTYGDVYPSYFWKPDNLWGAATYLHQGNDDKSIGVWKPKDRYNFYVHDSTKHLDYIASSCLGAAGTSGAVDQIKSLVTSIETGMYPDTGFYAGTMFIGQATLNDSVITTIAAMIDSLAPLVAQGKVVWQHLTLIADSWRTDHRAAAFRLACGGSTSCCTGSSGNVNTIGIIDLADLSMLIAYLTVLPKPTLPCPDEANVNAAGIIDLSDLSLLIAFLTASPKPTLPSCP